LESEIVKEERYPKLLIFPANLDAAHSIKTAASELGFDIIEASSESLESDNSHTQVEFLPYVNSSDFEKSLYDLVLSHKITHIYSPHVAVWHKLDKMLSEKDFQRDLSGKPLLLNKSSPFELVWQAENIDLYKEELKSLHLLKGPEQKNSNSMGEFKTKALTKLFRDIPGQSNIQKLSALIEIFPLLPQGDIVEIGVMYGKTAICMGWLSNYFNKGSVLAVDPWKSEDLEEQGSNAVMLNELSRNIDYEKIFELFRTQAALLPNIGYIQNKSELAISEYKGSIEQGCLKLPLWQEIPITGRISLLHIDGNHRYDMVKKDIELWTPFLISEGWLLVDDYRWAFGDGPKKAGDEILDFDEFDLFFCFDDTLYLRKR